MSISAFGVEDVRISKAFGMPPIGGILRGAGAAIRTPLRNAPQGAFRTKAGLGSAAKEMGGNLRQVPGIKRLTAATGAAGVGGAALLRRNNNDQKGY